MERGAASCPTKKRDPTLVCRVRYAQEVTNSAAGGHRKGRKTSIQTPYSARTPPA
jgi:hypothetical protein